jgi:serine/threonine-protein kinase BUR1
MPPAPADPSEIPKFEESHELDRRKFHDRKAALPPAPKGGTVGMGPEANGTNSGFNGGDSYGRNGMNGNRYPPQGGHRNGPEDRRPAWQRERGLPPRPPPPDYSNGWDGQDHEGYRDRGPRPRGPVNRGGDIDTYIPTYPREGAGGRHRDDRPPRDDRRRRNSRDDRWHDRRTRSRSRSPIRDRDRERDRERDRDRDIYRR